MPATRPGSQDIRDGDLTDVDVAAANKDGLIAVPSMRTLGTGSQQAAAGDDSRLAHGRVHYRHSALSAQPPGPRYYCCGSGLGTIGTVNISVNLGTIFFMPFFTTTDFTLRAWGFANGTLGTAAEYNLGLYDSIADDSLHPDTKIAETGVTSVTVSPTLLTGLTTALNDNSLYWLALVIIGTTSPLIRKVISGFAADNFLGTSSAIDTDDNGIGYFVNGHFTGALPATISTGSLTIADTNQPCLFYST